MKFDWKYLRIIDFNKNIIQKIIPYGTIMQLWTMIQHFQYVIYACNFKIFFYFLFTIPSIFIFNNEQLTFTC